VDYQFFEGKKVTGQGRIPGDDPGADLLVLLAIKRVGFGRVLDSQRQVELSATFALGSSIDFGPTDLLSKYRA
jgi:hypothetical protein